MLEKSVTITVIYNTEDEANKEQFDKSIDEIINTAQNILISPSEDKNISVSNYHMSRGVSYLTVTTVKDGSPSSRLSKDMDTI